MPKGALLTTQFFPARSKAQIEDRERIFSEGQQVTNLPLCIDCTYFFRGLPQTWTERDKDDFASLSYHEHASYELDIPDQAQRLLERCHVYDLRDMLERARDGTCQLCARIRSAFGYDNLAREEFSKVEEDCLAGKESGSKVRIMIQIHFNIGRFPYCLGVDIASLERKTQLWTMLYLITSTEANLSASGYPIGRSTSSDTSFDLAKSWLTTCLRDHPECRVSTLSDNVLPARLLDIEDVQKTGRILLRVTTTQYNKYEYLTLSHCWGKSHRLLLLKENLEELKSGIAMNRLTLTFQHAVDITRKLGYRYLWIDSLCIIQDSIEDWNVEAAKMASIYSESVCCIAATASRDSANGCFRDRDPLIRQPLKIEHSLFPELPAFNYPGPTLVAVDDILGGFFADSSFNRPLDTRAWTLQESILPPRTLGYCKDELSWECRKTTASEAWPVGMPGDIWNGTLSGYGKLVFDTSKLLPVEEKTDCLITNEWILYRRWEKLVNAYNERSLTEITDKFPALAGMTNMMISITRDQYCAGLWRRDFRRGLTWRISARNSPTTRPLEYLAPSWSWASVRSFAVYDDVSEYTSDMECEVEDIHVEHEGGNISGRVKFGKAILVGMIRRIQWNRDPKWTRARYLVDDDWTTWLDRNVEAVPDTIITEDPATVFLFQLYRSASTDTGHHHERNKHRMYGLILEPTDLSKNEFRRIGYMRTNGFSKFDPEDWRYFSDGWTRERITIF